MKKWKNEKMKKKNGNIEDFLLFDCNNMVKNFIEFKNKKWIWKMEKESHCGMMMEVWWFLIILNDDKSPWNIYFLVKKTNQKLWICSNEIKSY
jgi:hypothetical protein